MFDPSLFLSPRVFLLAILFRHRAFQSESLNDNPHLLVHPSGNGLTLGLKEEIKSEHIFRRCDKTSM